MDEHGTSWYLIFCPTNHYMKPLNDIHIMKPMSSSAWKPWGFDRHTPSLRLEPATTGTDGWRGRRAPGQVGRFKWFGPGKATISSHTVRPKHLKHGCVGIHDLLRRWDFLFGFEDVFTEFDGCGPCLLNTKSCAGSRHPMDLGLHELSRSTA